MPNHNEIETQSKNLLSIFATLSLPHQQQILAHTNQINIKAGQVLINKGEQAETLFFLKQGRLIVIADNKAIAEILPGESIGEMAFFTGSKRTATVIASRNSKLLQLDKLAYKDLIKDVPELSQSIIHSLANRLSTSNLSTPELEPKVSNVVALIPAGDGAIAEDFIKQLVNLDNELSTSWKILYAKQLENVEQLQEWIDENEENSGQLILIASNSNQQPAIDSAMAEHADKIFLIFDNTSEGPKTISLLEKTVYARSLLNNVDMVIVRENQSTKITGTAHILKGRKIHLHHHIALNQQSDFKRLQRFMAGKAIGLILCGGGALGTAHLGMLKALQEHDYTFDIVGGTSIGSVIASIYAMGQDADDALSYLEEVFIKKKALGKYTFPIYSFVDHRHVDEVLKHAAAKNDIEDLPINYFATATNLSSNQLEVLQTGPLWQAVRSSCSLPGILPPFITKSGDVLIDGGLIDNTPISSLRSLKSGANVVMNFTPQKNWKVTSNYEKLPRGWALFKHLILPKLKPQNYYPKIFTILSRAMVTNTIKRFSEVDQKEDIFLEPKILKGMGMMNWKKSRKQYELSYQQIKSELIRVDNNTNLSKIEKLKEVALKMSLDAKNN